MRRDDNHSGPAAPRSRGSRQAARSAPALLVVLLVCAVLVTGASPASAAGRLAQPARVTATIGGPPAHVFVKWAPSPGPGAYRVFRNGHLLVKQLRANRFVDRSVQRAKVYLYSVEICNRHGCSGRSSPARVATPRSVPKAPSWRRVSRTGFGVFVDWPVSVRATKYRVLRDGRVIARHLLKTQYLDRGIHAGVQHHYSVVACNVLGCSLDSGRRARRFRPSTPTGLNAVPRGSAWVNVSWRPSARARTYRLFRDGGVVAGAVADTSHLDGSLTSGTRYSYFVKACNERGCSSKSRKAEVTTAASGSDSPPARPTALNATAAPGQVTLGWGAVAGAVRYEVYRDGMQVSSVSGTSYVDSGLQPSSLYFYVVRACSDTACSIPSGPAVVRTSEPPSSCSGVNVTPSSNLQAAIDAHPAGTTLCLAAGTYHIGSTVVPKSSDILWGSPGAVLTGDDVTGTAIRGYSSYQTGVTIRGLTVEHFTASDGALSLGNGWVVQDNEIADNGGIGIRASSGTTIRGNRIHHNARYGLTGGPMSNSLIEDNEIAFNNSADSSTWNAGGTKIIKSSYVTFRGNYVHHNVGSGLHCDTDCTNVTYEGNLVTDNTEIGIFHEASYSAVISNNLVEGNDAVHAGETLQYGGQIRLLSSQDVDIGQNMVEASVAGTHGIVLYDYERGTGPGGVYKIADDVVHDNLVVLRAEGKTGLVGSAHHPTTLNNGFDDNTYMVPSTWGPYFRWGVITDWTGWQGAGQDLTGRISA